MVLNTITPNSNIGITSINFIFPSLTLLLFDFDCRFDISLPAYNFCKTFYNPDQKAVCVTEAFKDMTDESTMDCLSTAHFGLLSLYMGGNFSNFIFSKYQNYVP